MIDLSLAQVLDTGDLGLALGPADILLAEVGGRQVLYALARGEARVLEIELDATGLVVEGQIDLTGTWAAGQAPALSMTEVGLVVGGLTGGAGPLVTLGSTGALLLQTGLGTLAAPVAAVSTPGVGALILASGRPGASGLDLFRDAGAGAVWSGAVEDDATTYLDRVIATRAFDLGGSTWLAAVSGIEDGLTLIAVNPLTGTGSPGASLGAAEALPINDPAAIELVQRGSGAQIVLASKASSSLSVITVLADGTPVANDHIIDSQSVFLGGAAELGIVEHGGFVFVAAAGSEGGVSLYTLLGNGRLQHMVSVVDHNANTLYRPSGVELSVIGETLHLVVASEWDGGVTRFTSDLTTLGAVLRAPLGGAILDGTAGDDQIIGSDVADTLKGAGGHDILFDGSGRDLLIGGIGADLFVFAHDGLMDTVADFEPGLDRLDLSSFAFLHDIDQMGFVTEADGATLSFGDETVRLITHNAAPLPQGALTTDDILDVDRPPLSLQGQSLFGGAGDDTLIGGAQADTIMGGGGSDDIDGAIGDDDLQGEDGDDNMQGGAGSDRLDGGAGNDVILGDGGTWSDYFDFGG